MGLVGIGHQGVESGAPVFGFVVLERINRNFQLAIGNLDVQVWLLSGLRGLGASN